VAELNPTVAAWVQVLGVTSTPLVALLAADCMDAYVPLLAGAAAATPLTRVSSASRRLAAVSAPFAAAVPVELDAAVELDPPPHAASPATATGTSSIPDAIRQLLLAIPHPLTLWITHMTTRDDSAPGVTSRSR
jgi:hypothetical protein